MHLAVPLLPRARPESGLISRRYRGALTFWSRSPCNASLRTETGSDHGSRRRGRAAATRRAGPGRRDQVPGLYWPDPDEERSVQEMVIYGVSFDMVGKQPIVLLKTVE